MAKVKRLSEKQIHNRLQKYFEANFSEYADSAQYYTNPQNNMWMFDVKELGKTITLTCDEGTGTVTESQSTLAVAELQSASAVKANIIESLKQGQSGSFKYSPDSMYHLIYNGTLDKKHESNLLEEVYLSFSHSGRGTTQNLYQFKFFDSEITTQIEETIGNLLLYMEQLELKSRSDIAYPYKELLGDKMVLKYKDLLDIEMNWNDLRYEKEYIRKILQENLIPTIATGMFPCGSFMEFKSKETLIQSIRDNEDCGQRVNFMLQIDRYGDYVKIDEIDLKKMYFIHVGMTHNPFLELREEQLKNKQVIFTPNDCKLLERIQEFIKVDFTWDQLREVTNGLKSSLSTEEILKFAKSEMLEKTKKLENQNLFEESNNKLDLTNSDDDMER